MSRRKKYSKEFKINSISLVKKQSYSCSEAAKSLSLAKKARADSNDRIRASLGILYTNEFLGQKFHSIG